MKNYRFLLYALVFVFACNNSQSNQSEYTPSTSQSATEASTSSTQITIAQENGTQAGTISIEGSVIRIQMGSETLTGRVKGDKRKYENSNGMVVAEIKRSSDEQFKLRTPDGNLLWKVKLYEDKVKISDNEENENPYQIKTSEGKFKVKDAQDEEIGRITHDGSMVSLESVFYPRYNFEGKESMAYGTLYMRLINTRDQMIIMAELMSRGY